MPTLIELPEIDDCAGLCRELGLQFIELNMNLPQYQVNTIDLVRLKEIAAKHKIYYTIHLDENLNVSDFNPFVSEAYRHTVRETIKMARYLDIPVLTCICQKASILHCQIERCSCLMYTESSICKASVLFETNAKKQLIKII